MVEDCLEKAIAKASGDGEYRFSLRQLYYAVRPYVIHETGKEPDYNYFCRNLIGSYEAEHGDIPLMYRDERGTLYHPHCGQDIPIGTIADQEKFQNSLEQYQEYFNKHQEIDFKFLNQYELALEKLKVEFERL